jgi:hypothetical protein
VIQSLFQRRAPSPAWNYTRQIHEDVEPFRELIDEGLHARQILPPVAHKDNAVWPFLKFQGRTPVVDVDENVLRIARCASARDAVKCSWFAMNFEI